MTRKDCTSIIIYNNNTSRIQSNYDQVLEYLENGTPVLNRKLEKVLDQLELDEDGFIDHKGDQLILVSPDQVQAILKREYDDLSKSAGLGPETFYKVIRENFLGISWRETSRFLNAQPGYQVSANYTKRINRPILSRHPNGRWQMDLIDISLLESQNSHYRYILNVVDVFTRHLWAVPLKLKRHESSNESSRIFAMRKA